MNPNSKFFTEKAAYPKRGFVGKSVDFPTLNYGPANTRSAALSGIKRLVKKSQALLKPLTKVTLPTKRKTTHVALVIDRSGSMSSYGLIDVSRKLLNDNIKQIAEAAAKEGQLATVSVYSFADTVRAVRQNCPANACPEVQEHEISNGGSTALFGASILATEGLERALNTTPSDLDPAALLIVITDGENNRENHRSSELITLMKRLQATDRFTPTFLLPPGMKNGFVYTFAVPEGNCAEWEQTTKGVEQAATKLFSGTQSYFSLRSAGINKSTTFYSDTSKLTTKQVQNTLDDLSGQVRVFEVEKEEDIKTFVERKTRVPIILGASFYQLTKDEKKVQAYKQILIMEKGKKAIYGGSDARRLLGLPDGQDVKVKPGNHGKWDIFVQSTSTNRKLVRGTKLLYMPTASTAAVQALAQLRAH